MIRIDILMVKIVILVVKMAILMVSKAILRVRVAILIVRTAISGESLLDIQLLPRLGLAEAWGNLKSMRFNQVTNTSALPVHSALAPDSPNP